MSKASHNINTQKLSKSIPMYNVDSIPNEAEQISKVVNVILHYKTHSEQSLLAISSLGKQDLILNFIWLKAHSLKVD